MREGLHVVEVVERFVVGVASVDEDHLQKHMRGMDLRLLRLARLGWGGGTAVIGSTCRLRNDIVASAEPRKTSSVSIRLERFSIVCSKILLMEFLGYIHATHK